ncbi:hypothetical protein [Lacrimispora sp.]|uniref:hypothetical protein n=1 Tax=Lacrimispora sp. TaxID=2719234 RepID=UPI0028AC2492|nr:hypothetical protein [Lacrimispora sp.]
MKQDMRKYILRKLIELIITLLFVTLLSFLLMRLSAVDPATSYAKRMIGNPTPEQIEKIRVQLGFDKPLLVQYGRWAADLLHSFLLFGHCVSGLFCSPKIADFCGG